MGIQGIVNNLINNLDYVSITIIVLIACVFIIAVILNFTVSSTYKKYIKELSETNYEGMEIYKSKLLNSIVSCYKETYLKSRDLVNTQAIIESKVCNQNSKLISQEKFISSVNSLMLTLGFSGSIYGIICIVTNLTSVFGKAGTGDISDMQQVYGEIEAVISLMSYAFITLFIAGIATLLFSLISSMTNIELVRNSFFARMEDYLDNELGSTLSEKSMANKMANIQNANGEQGNNSNILYMLENTSHSMMTSTNKLETTISKLNESLLEILQNETKKIVPKPKENIELSSDVKTNMSLDVSREIINKQFEVKKDTFVDPINNVTPSMSDVNNVNSANNMYYQNMSQNVTPDMAVTNDINTIQDINTNFTNQSNMPQ